MSQVVDNSARGMSLSDYDDECFKAGPCPIIDHMRHIGPASQAHHRRMMNAIRGNLLEPFDLAVRLKSFDSDAVNPYPQLAGDSGGRWVVKLGQAGKRRETVLSLGLAACNQEMGSGSPRVKVIPQVSRKLVLESRDKEMLLEQVLDLKRSLFDHQIHLRHYKIQASMLDMENRLVTDICGGSDARQDWAKRRGSQQHMSIAVVEASKPTTPDGIRIKEIQTKDVASECQNANDRLFEKDGVTIVVDDISLSFEKGSTIDFSEELIQVLFTVAANPNASNGCGCGASFTSK